uniref:Protein IQ-DOMAIN 1 n=1 Tax=Ananas comosus var. bracteatus TaxID=296719 RepID=A0A6V7QJH2_ANACO|nr:unnamed protein product [Ananas comosus var. bracteatus]
MGSGDWFRTIVRKKKTKLLKGSASQQSNGFKQRNQANKRFSKLLIAACNGNDSGITIEDLAATRIQTAFRRYRARKTLRCLKGMKRLNVLANGHPVKKQASTTLSYIQSWSRIQAEIRDRRASMVTEVRSRQKRQENQMKLEAKLHDLEVEWCGGPESIEEIIARIQLREEAAVKRERAMAYAFSHQWRANSGIGLGPFFYEVGKGNWGWSWIERWTAARPWEPRIPALSTSPKRAPTKTPSKVSKSTNQALPKALCQVKPTLADAKSSTKRSSLPNEEKAVAREPKTNSISSSQQKPKNQKAKEQKISSQTG